MAREPGGEPDRVLIIETLGAPHPGARRQRRRVRRVDPPATPETVPVTRVTVARGEPLGDEGAASAWLEGMAADPARRSSEAKAALAVLNRALGALREAAEDPLIHDVGASQALAIRVGYGTGDELADGRWSEARQLPPPPRARREDLDPQEQVARALSGRESQSGPD